MTFIHLAGGRTELPPDDLDQARRLRCELESLDQQIASIESQILVVEKDVSELEQQLKVLRGSAVSDKNSRAIDGLLIELAAKTKKEEQLRDEKKQLRDEKKIHLEAKQLREKNLLLDHQDKNQGQRP